MTEIGSYDATIHEATQYHRPQLERHVDYTDPFGITYANDIRLYRMKLDNSFGPDSSVIQLSGHYTRGSEEITHNPNGIVLSGKDSLRYVKPIMDCSAQLLSQYKLSPSILADNIFYAMGACKEPEQFGPELIKSLTDTLMSRHFDLQYPGLRNFTFKT